MNLQVFILDHWIRNEKYTNQHVEKFVEHQLTGAARVLLGSRHLVVKIMDFTDFHFEGF